MALAAGNEHDYVAERFEGHRTHLRAVAYRMLGSVSEVDDAVQEAWLGLNRADATGIDNLGGWLTTVVARVCLDMLRWRQSQREAPCTPDAPEPVATGMHGSRREQGALLAEPPAATRRGHPRRCASRVTFRPTRDSGPMWHHEVCMPVQGLAANHERGLRSVR